MAAPIGTRRAMRTSSATRTRPADSRLPTPGRLRRLDAAGLGEGGHAGGHDAGDHRGVAEPDRDAHEHAGLARLRDVEAADHGAPGDDEEDDGHEQVADPVEG